MTSSEKRVSGVGKAQIGIPPGPQPAPTLSESERLYRLALGVLECLDAERERTGVDEWDESDFRCFLYNAASAVIERTIHGDQFLDDCLDSMPEAQE